MPGGLQLTYSVAVFSLVYAFFISIILTTDGNSSLKESAFLLYFVAWGPIWQLKNGMARVKGKIKSKGGTEGRTGRPHKSKGTCISKELFAGPSHAHNSLHSSSPCVREKRGAWWPQRKGRGEGGECKSECRFVDIVRRACWLTGWFIGFFQLITAGLWPNGSPAKLKGSRGKQAYKHKAA